VQKHRKMNNKVIGLHRGKDGYWMLDKRVIGYGRLNRSTRTKDYIEAKYRAELWIKEAESQGIALPLNQSPRITFNQAVELYIKKEKNKPKIQRKKPSTMECDLNDIKKLTPYIGALHIDQVHQDTINPYIDAEVKRGKKASTVNRSLRVLVYILKLCATSWRNDHHQPYLKFAPEIAQLPEIDKRTTQPLEYHEEKRLLGELNDDYKMYWQFAVHTGVRQMTQAKLQWEWEVKIPQCQRSGFIVPSYIKHIKNTKNGKAFLLILNRIAQSIIDQQRGKHKIFVFPSVNGKAHGRFNQSHFQSARKRAGLQHVATWHSARATFASRLRAAKVGEEDRAQLLGHSKSITTQYSWASIIDLVESVDQLCNGDSQNDPEMDLHSLFRFSR